MNKSSIYLNSLLKDAAENGLVSPAPAIPEDQTILMERAAYLAGKKNNGTYQAVSSIFSYVSVNGVQAQKRYFPFQSLNLSKQYFPQSTQTGDLAGLKNGFETEYHTLRETITDEVVHAETLLHLLHKYAAMLPSQVAEEISLYDYAKIKAAIAVCLAEPETDPEQPFLMVGGDTSGIQEFIYSIVSANAAKNLKGRSYYLHLLADTVLQRLLRELGLFQANVVYASGGSFFVLVPNNTSNQLIIKQLESEINRHLFADWGTGLSIVFSCYTFDEKTLIENRINDIWKALFDGFSQRKRERLNSLVQHNYDDLFNPVETGGEVRRDAISHEEIIPTANEYYKLGNSIPELADRTDYDNNETELVNGKTKEQIMLGLYMKSEMYRASGSSGLTFDFGNVPFDAGREMAPADIEVKHFILNSTTHLQRAQGPMWQVMKINDTDFIQMLLPTDTVRGFEFYGGNQYPVSIFEQFYRGIRERAPKTFSEMAGTKDEERARESPSYADKFKEASFKRLAILRMDVDGLGEVFRTFTGSLAHFSALSRQLDWFFKGYLNTLWNERTWRVEVNEGKWRVENFKDWSQIIYSGGDDLFLVGKWDCLLEFAQVIQKEFRDWTCEHPQLGISGGIVFVTHKFPVIRAAELCDDAERFAKEHNFVANNGSQVIWSKNALTAFDHPLHWDHELPIVSGVKDELVKYANADLLPRGFIISLQNFHALKVQQKNTPNESPTWRWQMAYQIARLLQRLEKRHGAKDREATMPTKLFEFLRELQTGIFIGQYKGQPLQSNYDFFDLIAISARWAEYELRSINRNENTSESQEN